MEDFAATGEVKLPCSVGAGGITTLPALVAAVWLSAMVVFEKRSDIFVVDGRWMEDGGRLAVGKMTSKWAKCG